MVQHSWTLAAGLIAVALFLAAGQCRAADNAGTQPAGQQVSSSSDATRAAGLAIAAALSTGLGIVGAGYAVGHIGSAALGAAAEKPEMLTRSLLFVALAEGLAVLGFAVGMLLFQKIGP